VKRRDPWQALAGALAYYPGRAYRAAFAWPAAPGGHVSMQELTFCLPAVDRAFVGELRQLIDAVWAIDLHERRAADAAFLLHSALGEDLIFVNHGKGTGVLRDVANDVLGASGFERVAQSGHTAGRPEFAISVFASRRLLSDLVELRETNEPEWWREKAEELRGSTDPRHVTPESRENPGHDSASPRRKWASAAARTVAVASALAMFLMRRRRR
jgi:hypothetical protein